AIAQQAADNLFDEQMLAEEIEQNFANATSTASQALAQTVIESGMFDAETFVTDFLEPLLTDWNDYLGPEGSVTTTTTNWAMSTTTDVGNVSTAFTTMGQEVSKAMTETLTAVTS